MLVTFVAEKARRSQGSHNDYKKFRSFTPCAKLAQVSGPDGKPPQLRNGVPSTFALSGDSVAVGLVELRLNR